MQLRISNFLVLSTLLCPKVSKAYIIYIRYFLIEPNKNPDPYIIALDDSYDPLGSDLCLRSDWIKMWTDYTNSQPLWFLYVSYRNPESRINVHFLLNSLKITLKTFDTSNGETQSALQRKQSSHDLWYVSQKKKTRKKFRNIIPWLASKAWVLLLTFSQYMCTVSSNMTFWVKMMRNLCDLSLPLLTIIYVSWGKNKKTKKKKERKRKKKKRNG